MALAPSPMKAISHSSLLIKEVIPMANTLKFLPKPWTREDVLFLIQQVDSGKFVLVADPNLGIPTIHQKFPVEVRHAGMGLMVVDTPKYELSFDAGGSMQKTPSGQSWTELRVVKGECPLNKAGLRAKLAALLTLPTEQAAAEPVKNVDELMAEPDPADENVPEEPEAAPEPAAQKTAEVDVAEEETPQPAPANAPAQQATEVALPLDLGEMVDPSPKTAKPKIGKKATIRVPKADLARILAIVNLGAKDKKAARIEGQKENKRLIVTGFDSGAATAIEGTIKADVSADIVVHVLAATFKGAVDTMPDGPVTIKIAGQELKVESKSQNKHTLQLLADVDFPVVYGNDPVELFAMPGAEAKRLMMAANYAASPNSIEATAAPAVTSVVVTTQKSNRTDYPLIVDARAYSGYNGVILKSFGTSGKEGQSLALTASTLSLASKILTAGGNLGETLVAFGRVGDGKYHISFKVGGVGAVLATPEAGVKFDAQKFDGLLKDIRGQAEKATVEFDAAEVLSAIKSVGFYATDTEIPNLYMDVTGARMRFAGQKTVAGECHGEIGSAKVLEGSKDAFRLFGVRVLEGALADLRHPKMIMPVNNMQVVLVEGGTLVITAPLVVPPGFKRPAFDNAEDQAATVSLPAEVSA